MTNATITKAAAQAAEVTYIKVGEKGKQAADMLARASQMEKAAKELKEAAKLLAAEAGMELQPNVIGTYHGVPILKTKKHTDTRANLRDLLAAFPEAYDATVTSKVTYYVGV